MRLEDHETILISPSGVDVFDLRENDFVEISLDGSVKNGPYKPSIDLIFHIAVYRERQDVCAIVHTHSRFATSWACVGEPIVSITPGHIMTIGEEVGVAKFAPPESDDLGINIVQALGNGNVVLMQNHGVLAVGDGLPTAVINAFMVESAAQLQVITSLIGGARNIEPEMKTLIGGLHYGQ